MTKPPRWFREPPVPPRAPRQLSIRFDSVQLRGVNPSERARALALLANLLMQAAGAAVVGSDDDER
jgi:hypothetical protein